MHQFFSFFFLAKLHCERKQRMCADDSGCYELNQKCDFKEDCSDGSDEFDCGKY